MVNRDKYNRSSKKDLLRRLEREAEDDVGDSGGDEEASGKSEGKSEYKDVSGRNLKELEKGRSEGRNEDLQEGKKRGLLSFLPLLIPLVTVLAVVVVAIVFMTDNPGSTVPYVGPLKSFDNSRLYSEYTDARFVPRCAVSSPESMPEMSAEIYIAVYVETFHIVAEKNAEEKTSFASIVKLLGVLVALDAYKVDQELALLDEVDTLWNGLDLEVGESVSVEDLIGAALIGSRNDAMYVLSQNYPGGEEAFIIEMNQKAQVLGMNDTMVQNVIGLDDLDQYSTARDIGILSVVAMRNSVIRSIVSQPVYTVNMSSGRTEQIYNTNLLLGDVEGVVGLKTGYTGEAGLCLVSYIDGNRDFVTVVLNAEDRAEESRELIEWVRSNVNCERPY